MSETVRTRLRLSGVLAMTGLTVGLLVATAAGSFAGGSCGSGESGLAAMLECRSLVHVLALRMGLLAGVGTVVMSLFVLGLRRMAVQDDRDRRVARSEAIRAELGE